MTHDPAKGTEELFLPSTQAKLAADDDERRPIPPEIRQEELARLGRAVDNNLPAAGTDVEIGSQQMKVTGYSKGGPNEVLAQVDIPSGDSTIQSHVDVRALADLDKQ